MQAIPLFELEPTPTMPRCVTAMERKRNGQFKAAKHAGAKWQALMLDVLRKFLFHLSQQTVGGRPEFTFEDFRVYAENAGHPGPRSINAWGTLPLAACKAGLCEWTGKVQPGKREESHRRLLKVWVMLPW